MIILNNETRKLVFQNTDIAGFSLNSIVDAASGQALNLKKLLLSVKLNRGGKETILYNDNLYAAAAKSAFKKSSWKTALGVAGSGIAIGAGTGTGTLELFTPEYDLERVINLRGEDTLEAEVTIMDGYFSGTTVAAAGCKVEFNEIAGIGVEFSTGLIKSKNIPVGESRFTLSMGDNVESVMILDTAQVGSYSASDMGVLNVNLSSDKVNRNMNKNQLLSQRVAQFGCADEPVNRGNCFMIHDASFDGAELDKVKLDITLDAAKVTTGRYIIVYRTFETDARLVQTALARTQKHKQQDYAKIQSV